MTPSEESLNLDIDLATLISTDVEMDISGIVARVVVTQSFKNPGDEWIEGLYIFPLPEDSAVD
ncbi:MAG TPA: VIT domain-containing protein, partial [Arenicellales bacterium]|nr:VIT domain-containing protein [Arenicellales bacterium]